MKIILTQKAARLGSIGDTVEVATGYARNYLLPNGKALRWSKENIAKFESEKAGLIARQESEKKTAEENLPKITAAKLHLIRSAGDAGRLYGSVSSRDIAKLLGDLTGVAIMSEQVLLGQPIKEIGAVEINVQLHPDVVAAIKVYIARTQEEIDMLVAGKDIKKDAKRLGTNPDDIVTEIKKAEEKPKEKPADAAAPAEKTEPESSESREETLGT